jgi:hypothetical protein
MCCNAAGCRKSRSCRGAPAVVWGTILPWSASEASSGGFVLLPTPFARRLHMALPAPRRTFARGGATVGGTGRVASPYSSPYMPCGRRGRKAWPRKAKTGPPSGQESESGGLFGLRATVCSPLSGFVEPKPKFRSLFSPEGRAACRVRHGGAAFIPVPRWRIRQRDRFHAHADRSSST